MTTLSLKPSSVSVTFRQIGGNSKYTQAEPLSLALALALSLSLFLPPLFLCLLALPPVLQSHLFPLPLLSVGSFAVHVQLISRSFPSSPSLF